MTEQKNFDMTLAAVRFAEAALPHRLAYRAGEITYSEMRRRIGDVPCTQTPRTQCRMALSWLKKARAAGVALMWWEHGHYIAAARRSIETIASSVWRARMSRAADAIAAMMETRHA